MNAEELFIDGHRLPSPLSKDEIYSLIKTANEGSKEAREKVIIHNIRLVIYEVSHKFQSIECDKKDLVSAGIIGLLKAIDTFDLTKNIEFATYATRCIDNEILVSLRKLRKNRNVDSLDRVIIEDKNYNETKLKDIITDDKDMVEEYETIEIYRTIKDLVMKLPDRDKEIIMLYFGFYDDRIYTQKEIANICHITQSTVSKIIIKNIEKLRKQLEEIYFIKIAINRSPNSKVLSLKSSNKRN